MKKIIFVAFTLCCTDVCAIFYTELYNAILKNMSHYQDEDQKTKLRALGKHIDDVSRANELDQSIQELMRKGKAALKSSEAMLILSEAGKLFYDLWVIDRSNIHRLKKAVFYFQTLIDNHPEEFVARTVFEDAAKALISLNKVDESKATIEIFQRALRYLEVAVKKFKSGEVAAIHYETLAFLHNNIAKIMAEKKEDFNKVYEEYAKACACYETAFKTVGVQNASRILLQNAGDVYFQMTSFCSGKKRDNAYFKAVERYGRALLKLEPLTPDFPKRTVKDFVPLSQDPVGLIDAALASLGYLVKSCPHLHEKVKPYIKSIVKYFSPLFVEGIDFGAYHIEIIKCAATAQLILFDLTNDQAVSAQAQKLYDYLIGQHRENLRPIELNAAAALFQRAGELEMDPQKKLAFFRKADGQYAGAIDKIREAQKTDDNAVVTLTTPRLWTEAIDNLIKIALLMGPTPGTAYLERADEYADFILNFRPFNEVICKQKKTLNKLRANKKSDEKRAQHYQEALNNFQNYLETQRANSQLISRSVANYQAYFEGLDLNEVEAITLCNAGAAYVEYALLHENFLVTAMTRAVEFLNAAAEKLSLEDMEVVWLQAYARAVMFLAHSQKDEAEFDVEDYCDRLRYADEIYTLILAKLNESEVHFLTYSDAATTAFFLWDNADDMKFLYKAAELYDKAIALIKVKKFGCLNAKKPLLRQGVAYMQYDRSNVPGDIFLNAAQSCIVLGNEKKKLGVGQDHQWVEKAYDYYTWGFAGHNFDAVPSPLLVSYADVAYSRYMHTENKHYADRAYEILCAIIKNDSLDIPAGTWKQAGFLSYLKWNETRDNAHLFRSVSYYDKAIELYHSVYNKDQTALQQLAVSGLFSHAAEAHLQVVHFCESKAERRAHAVKAQDYLREQGAAKRRLADAGKGKVEKDQKKK